MKKKKFVLYTLMLLPLVAVLLALQFLPDRIPAHYGADGQVTRWGSKFETLIFPALSILLGLFMLEIGKIAARQEKSGCNNENVCLVTGIAILALLDAMAGYFLYLDFYSVENLTALPMDVNQLIFGLLGGSMVILGNVMPKLRMNSVAGLRTMWSMKNEITWKKSQRFGGISFIVGGVTVITMCCLTRGPFCFLWTMAILAAVVTVDILYTYLLSKNID